MNEDRLDWLREIRGNIAKQCDNDPKAMGNYFREMQEQYKSRVIPDSNIVEVDETPVSERISA